MAGKIAQTIRTLIKRGDNQDFQLKDDWKENGTARYVVDPEEIGEGFQGAVFRADDKRLGIPVAVKFELTAKDVDHKKFYREAQLAAKASAHANVVGVFDLGNWDTGTLTVLYIVFQYMTGGYLRTLVKEGHFFDTPNEPATLEDKLSAVGEAIGGLTYIHKFLVHRDIKPENLLRGPDGIVRVADFGFARTLDGDSVSKSGSSGISIPGTAGYQAPELITGTFDKSEPAAGKAIDVFAMGVTAYEILCGVPPFQWSGTLEGQEQWFMQVQEGHVQFNGDGTRLSRAVQDMIAGMLAYDPKKRPSMEKAHEIMQREVNQAFLQVSSEFDQIRQAITRKVQAICALFAAERSPVVPEFRERQKDWYMTILVRPTIARPQTNPYDTGFYRREDMGGKLYPIYLPHYDGSQLKHWCDWLHNKNQPFTPLEISHCCSGLVIDYHDDKIRTKWEAHRWLDNDFVHFETAGKNQIRYLALRNVKMARGFAELAPAGAALITSRYMTDHSRGKSRGLGFYMTDAEGNVHQMSDDIDTEMVFPIYAPGAIHNDSPLTGNDIVGVVNIEWDVPLSSDRIRTIGDRVAKWVNTEHRFPISPLIAELIELVTGGIPQSRG